MRNKKRARYYKIQCREDLDKGYGRQGRLYLHRPSTLKERDYVMCPHRIYNTQWIKQRKQYITIRVEI